MITRASRVNFKRGCARACENSRNDGGIFGFNFTASEKCLERRHRLSRSGLSEYTAFSGMMNHRCGRRKKSGGGHSLHLHPFGSTHAYRGLNKRLSPGPASSTTSSSLCTARLKLFDSFISHRLRHPGPPFSQRPNRTACLPNLKHNPASGSRSGRRLERETCPSKLSNPSASNVMNR